MIAHDHKIGRRCQTGLIDRFSKDADIRVDLFQHRPHLRAIRAFIVLDVIQILEVDHQQVGPACLDRKQRHLGDDLFVESSASGGKVSVLFFIRGNQAWRY